MHQTSGDALQELNSCWQELQSPPVSMPAQPYQVHADLSEMFLGKEVLGNHPKPTSPHTSVSELRNLLQSCASSCNSPQNTCAAAKVGDLDCSFARAEAVAWDTFQDSLLNYDLPTEERLDLLEVYAYADSRLTDMIRQHGGKAERFTKADGDLATVEGQRKLFEVLQRKQPCHIWVAHIRMWSMGLLGSIQCLPIRIWLVKASGSPFRGHGPHSSVCAPVQLASAEESSLPFGAARAVSNVGLRTPSEST